MYEGSLLERIRHVDQNPTDRGNRNVSKDIRSIVNHLKKVLNTRQGSVQVAEDFGMPDITNFQGDDLSTASKQLEGIISQVIQNYEPRLQKIRVRFDPLEGDVLRLRFKLEADMIGGEGANRPIPVVFETVVTSGGMVLVEE